MRPLFALILAVPLLAGCLTQIDGRPQLAAGVDLRSQYWCKAAQFDAAKAADWSNAEVIKEEIKDNLYSIGLISLWRKKPYIIEVTNLDDSERSFRAPNFFKNSSILKAVYDGKTVETPCMESVTLGPGKSAEIHVVPTAKGSFDYHDTALWIPFLTQLTTNGDIGLIHVQ